MLIPFLTCTVRLFSPETPTSKSFLTILGRLSYHSIKFLRQGWLYGSRELFVEILKRQQLFIWINLFDYLVVSVMVPLGSLATIGVENSRPSKVDIRCSLGKSTIFYVCSDRKHSLGPSCCAEVSWYVRIPFGMYITQHSSSVAFCMDICSLAKRTIIYLRTQSINHSMRPSLVVPKYHDRSGYPFPVGPSTISTKRYHKKDTGWFHVEVEVYLFWKIDHHLITSLTSYRHPSFTRWWIEHLSPCGVSVSFFSLMLRSFERSIVSRFQLVEKYLWQRR